MAGGLVLWNPDLILVVVDLVMMVGLLVVNVEVVVCDG